jgi:hypothetical protein
MTNEDLQAYLQRVGLGGDIIVASNGGRYVVARDFLITKGTLVGTRCDVAVQWSAATPYVAAPAIHTKPALVAMGTKNTQTSPIGPEWQYWSRRMVASPTPQAVVAHIATILGEV